MKSENSATQCSSDARIHLRYLDGLRAIAALYVVGHHMLLQAYPNLAAIDGFGKAYNSVFGYGHYAVGVFIVLSGFCLMLPVVRKTGTISGGALHFFKRRAIRILPTYYCALAVTLGLIFFFIHQKTGAYWDKSLPVTVKGVVSHLLLIHDAVGEDVSINHVFWSIAVEWRIYFLFPLLVWGWRSLGAVSTTLIALVGSFGLFHLGQIAIGSNLSAHYLGLFVLGMLATTIAFSDQPNWLRLRQLPWHWITLGLSVILAVLLKKSFFEDYAAQMVLVDYTVGFWASALLVWITINPKNRLRQALGFKPLVAIGGFAYSLYLIHAPLIQLLWQYWFVPFQQNPALMMSALLIAGTPMIVALSHLFYLAFERPFLSQRKA